MKNYIENATAQTLMVLWFQNQADTIPKIKKEQMKKLCGTKQLLKMITSNVWENLQVIKSSNLCEAKMKSIDDETNYRLIIFRISPLFIFLSKIRLIFLYSNTVYVNRKQ